MSDDHPFEQQGLGTAPFRLADLRVHPTLAATCDYCGTGLKREFIVEGADGRSFSVGSECVKKTADRGLIKATEEKSKQVTLARVAELSTDERVRRVLAGRPHPTAYYAKQGKSLLDYVDFIGANCGDTAKAKLLSELESAATESEPHP